MGDGAGDKRRRLWLAEARIIMRPTASQSLSYNDHHAPLGPSLLPPSPSPWPYLPRGPSQTPIVLPCRHLRARKFLAACTRL